jgi:hypothetical protein
LVLFKTFKTVETIQTFKTHKTICHFSSVIRGSRAQTASGRLRPSRQLQVQLQRQSGEEHRMDEEWGRPRPQRPRSQDQLGQEGG